MSGGSLGAKLRWWRDRAKLIVYAGLIVYCFGYLLDWAFELDSSVIFKWLGAAIVVIGTVSCFLWLVDPDVESRPSAADDEP